jgi:hypothetical protein
MTQNYEPKVVQEIHAIRREIQAETQGMSPSERCEYFRDGTMAFFAQSGITPKYVQSSAQALK